MINLCINLLESKSSIILIPHVIKVEICHGKHLALLKISKIIYKTQENGIYHNSGTPKCY